MPLNLSQTEYSYLSFSLSFFPLIFSPYIYFHIYQAISLRMLIFILWYLSNLPLIFLALLSVSITQFILNSLSIFQSLYFLIYHIFSSVFHSFNLSHSIHGYFFSSYLQNYQSQSSWCPGCDTKLRLTVRY